MIVIAGKNNIAVEALNYLLLEKKIAAKNIAVIFNATDNGKDTWQLSFRKRCKNLGIQEISLIEAEKCADIFISLEFDQLVNPKKFIKARLFNIHFSLLPKYKGMFSSIWPILNGEEESGCTLHEIDSGIDTGKIIDQVSFPLRENDCAADLYYKYLEFGIFLFKKNFEDLKNGTYICSSQYSKNSSYYSRKSINFKENLINLNATAWQIGRQIKAFGFRWYQLPVVFGSDIVNYEIHNQKTQGKPGQIIYEDCYSIKICTVDYDLSLYKDRSKDIFDFIKMSDCENLDILIKNMASVEDRSAESWTLLMVAAYHGRLAAIRSLINLGANVKATNYRGTTVLMYAKDYVLRSGNADVFKELINAGADMDVKDLNGNKLEDYITKQEFNLLRKGSL